MRRWLDLIHRFPHSTHFKNPILSARLEAVKLLGDRLAEPIAVLDRDLTVVYANETAWPSTSRPDQAVYPSKCYEAFMGQDDPCGICPARNLLENSETHTVSCSAGADWLPCGIREALPLMSAQGEVALVLALFSGQTSRRQPGSSASGVGLPADHSDSRLGDLIGQAPVMRELFRMIHLVADSAATVLIQGESGTGKELVARTIHRVSYRGAKPFVVVDCGSLPETLLESELFGHMRGAFTGALSTKRGLFEEADGGTLFLDEIANTTPTFQAKLLRVLQEGEIKRVGDTQPLKIDVRVISATNKDLIELVKSNLFRQDLYYRLAVLPLDMPALRDRAEDIPHLVRYFVRASCRRAPSASADGPAYVMQALMGVPWRGNVRELQHYIERAVVTTEGPELTCPDILETATDPAQANSALRSVEPLNRQNGSG